MLEVNDVLAPPNRLAVLRAERRAEQGGWTQTIVARRAGISSNRYWRIENRESAATRAEQNELAAIFGVPRAQVFPPLKKSKKAPPVRRAGDLVAAVGR